ncbi:MAG: hypothetical protein ACTSU5_11545 [Promethearchaeota archaeon]
MQKIRAALFKFAASIGILGQEELFRLIAEETDIIDARLKLAKEQEEAATVLEAYAQAEEEEIKDIMMEVVRDTRDMNKAQMELLGGLKEQYIDVLSTIREKLLELDEPIKEKNKVDSALEKAKKNLDSKRKKAEQAKIKADPAKVSAAEDAVKTAESELAAAEEAQKAAQEKLDALSAEIRAYKKETLKKAFTNYTELGKAYHEKCLALLTEYGGAVKKIEPESE